MHRLIALGLFTAVLSGCFILDEDDEAVKYARRREKKKREREKRIPITIDAVDFDPATVAYRREDGDCFVVAGNTKIVACGRGKTGKSRALALVECIKRNRLNRRCYVQRSRPFFLFFLRDGQAPTGTRPGAITMPVKLHNLRVKWGGARWWIVDGERNVCSVSDIREDAEYVLNLILQYGFTAYCRPGDRNGVLESYWVR